MTIDSQVFMIASAFDFDPAFLQAMVVAEGGPEAFIRAAKCSIPETTTYQQALRVGARSFVHAMSDFIRQCRPPAFDWDGVRTKDFVEGLGACIAAKWAPYPVNNDPKGLNKNWPGNFVKAYRQIKADQAVHA